MIADYFSRALLIPYLEFNVDSENDDHDNGNDIDNDDHDNHDDGYDDDSTDDHHDDDGRNHDISEPSSSPANQPTDDMPSEDLDRRHRHRHRHHHKGRPTHHPTHHPAIRPSHTPTHHPTITPSANPTATIEPTGDPGSMMSLSPTSDSSEPLLTPIASHHKGIPTNLPTGKILGLPPAIDIDKARSIYPTIVAAMPIEMVGVNRDDGETLFVSMTIITVAIIFLYFICSCYIKRVRKTWQYRPIEARAFHMVHHMTNMHEVQRTREDVPLTRASSELKPNSYQYREL